jgi:putative molybdopterin biosynthesis protein
MAPPVPPPRRGVHLEYRFAPDPHARQHGAELANPLVDLLRTLRDTGSISAAARALGASYRHTWGALKQWETTLDAPLVVWVKGQNARLTPLAERLLWAESRARVRLTPHIEALRSELERVLALAFDAGHEALGVWASHDLALPLLRERADASGLHLELRFSDSADALRALGQGRCDVAGFHVPVLDAGPSAHFARALKGLLKPGRHKLIASHTRTQGLMAAHGNPREVLGLADLPRPGLRFVNRQPGSGTRLLAEHLLAQAGIEAERIDGFHGPCEDTHVAVAAAVASGLADVGLGIEAAAASFGLHFVPLATEDYFLVCLKDTLERHPGVARLRALLATPDWAATLTALPGTAARADAGSVPALTKALPWWRYRVAKGAPRG